MDRPSPQRERCDRRERFGHPPLHLRLREVQVPGAESAVLFHGRGKELVVRVLEDEADPLVELLSREASDLPPADGDPPRLCLEEADEELDQRRLPRAVGAQDRNELALFDAEIDSGERLGPVVVGEGDPLNIDRPHPVIPPREKPVSGGDHGQQEGEESAVPAPQRRERSEGHRPPVAAQPHCVMGPAGLFERVDDRCPGKRGEGGERAARRRVAETEALGGGEIARAVHQDEDVSVHQDRDFHPLLRDPESAERLEDPVGRRRDAEEEDNAEGAKDARAEEQPLPEPLGPRRERPAAEGQREERRRPGDEGLDHDQDRDGRKRRGEAQRDELRRDPECGDGPEAKDKDGERENRPR